jgi:hypothetical protein
VSASGVPGFDQRQWQELTTWTEKAPSLAEAWTLLTTAELPAAFLAAVHTSSHQFVRQLQRSKESVELEPRKEWNNRFANLVSGRYTEILFANAYKSAIEARGLSLIPKQDKRDWHDYWIDGDGGDFQLAINIKNAGVQFRQAASFVGMDADDTLPIATYKIFGSSGDETQLPLVYVYLVDWTLLPRLRSSYWDLLNEAERRLFQMTARFKGMPRDLEDSFIEATVADRVQELSASVGYDVRALRELPFRAISGARCKSIFYKDHGRSPYVFLQRMNTDPNVHVSVKSETIHFNQFIERWLSSRERRVELLTGLRHTSVMAIPDPPM